MDIILVPGLWLDASSWDDVVPALQRAGHAVHALTMPGVGAPASESSEIGIADWVGSQNHNWGSRHTDRYAWGQVAGFDEVPDAFLECATARLRVGPLWTPWMSPVVLRLRGETLGWNGLACATRAREAGERGTPAPPPPPARGPPPARRGARN